VTKAAFDSLSSAGGIQPIAQKMRRSLLWKCSGIATLALLCAAAAAQLPKTSGNSPAANAILFTVVDDDGLAVPGARLVISAANQPEVRLSTDYAGHATWTPPRSGPFSVTVSRPGYYETSASGFDTQDTSIKLALAQEQLIRQQVNVTASTPGIDPQQTSNRMTMTTEEIVNVPYPTYRDILNLLPFTPGVVADTSGQIHAAGGDTWMTLDTLDGFDIRDPVFGTFDLLISPDAVRSIDTETTRYPVQYGRSTAGVVAFTTGTGDNKFNFDATNFLPSFRNQKGIRFDTLEPMITFSGPLVRNRAWFFDGSEVEYNNQYFTGLPSGADTNPLFDSSNLLKFQTNLGSANSLTTALLVNDYHSPYNGLSNLTPRSSTTNNDVIAWLPYLRDQQSFRNGVMVDAGFGVLRYRDGFEPHGSTPYVLTPDTTTGSSFETQTTRTQRLEGYADAFFPSRQWHGAHQLRAGIELAHIGFEDYSAYAPVNYVREDGSLSRRSAFPAFPLFMRHNADVGAYLEDRWTPRSGLLVEPGLRFDWDEIVRRPLFSPRIAINYSPPGQENTTKFSAGIGVYYGHTDLDYLARSLTGVRYDTYYAADGVTPLGPAEKTTFTVEDGLLRQPRAINWSIGLQHKLPWNIYADFNFMQRRTSDLLVYANQNGTGAQPGNYLLTNDRQDRYHSVEIDGRKTFRADYTLFAAYTRSSATTNAALDYAPAGGTTLGPPYSGLPATPGLEQSGLLPWDTPNRVISWGWLPAWAPFFPSIHKNWDFIYSFLWNNGFPFDAVNENQTLVGRASAYRFPNFFDFSPGLEWRFHFRGKYFGLRGMYENATNSLDPYVVNNNIDSPQFLTFSQPLGRAFVTRIRLIRSSK
jgi:hypothetical protein